MQADYQYLAGGSLQPLQKMRGDPVPVWVCVAAPTPELPTWDPGGKEADPAKGR